MIPSLIIRRTSREEISCAMVFQFCWCSPPLTTQWQSSYFSIRRSAAHQPVSYWAHLRSQIHWLYIRVWWDCGSILCSMLTFETFLNLAASFISSSLTSVTRLGHLHWQLSVIGCYCNSLWRDSCWSPAARYTLLPSIKLISSLHVFHCHLKNWIYVFFWVTQEVWALSKTCGVPRLPRLPR